MILKPPFFSALSVEEEIRAFEALNTRLHSVWDIMVSSEDQPFTAVVVPSLTLDQGELAKLEGAPFYEERLLFLLIRLRNPFARMVYVTSQPLHPVVLDYYLQFLAGVPANHARARLTLLCTYDSSPRSLTEKVLERPRLVQRIRESIPDPQRAYLTVFNSTPLERRLAVLLGIPLNGLDPELSHLGTKSGSRKIFREAGVLLPDGFEDLRTEEEVVRGLEALRRMKPGLKRAVIKLDESFSGEGNALFRYPESGQPGAIADALDEIEFSVRAETRESYFGKLTRMGGIVEEFIDRPRKTSPSSQLRTSPRGQVFPISTHDQILGGPGDQVFLGCRFPADDHYRAKITEAGVKVGEVLARHGAVSRFGVDFLAWPDEETGEWETAALEINLRIGGTTHPYLALRFLTGGEIDPSTGHFLSISGRPKFYRSTDNLRSEDYRGMLPDDLIEILTVHKLHYSHRTESGVLFHLIGALSEYGKIGMTVIGNSREEVDELHLRTLEILDRETEYARRR